MRAFCIRIGLLYLALIAHGFPIICQKFHRRSSLTLSNKRRSSDQTVIPSMSKGMDYEYIPLNPSAPAPYSTDLRSVYPPGTPAGLRGEAVRSALRSTRCLAWDLGSSPLESGLLSIEGKGTVDFLQNKFSQLFEKCSKHQFTQACLLDAKGKVLDLVGVVQTSSPTKAYLWTSPGHKGSALYNRQDPLIFPMDEVKLKDCTKSTRIISVASTRIEHVQRVLRQYVQPLLPCRDDEARLPFPSDDSSECISLADDCSLLILPSVGLPTCACVGYTLVFTDVTAAASTRLPERVWNALVGNDSPDGPIELGPLEYETLRIEAGQPAFGKELTAAANKKGSPAATAAGPLELHWQSYLDLDKGCYLGQEGVASVVKNPRGPPRLLYSVVFHDEDNIYQHQSDGEKSRNMVENLTTLPQPGQELFVLGSNEQILVGTLTSIAEPGGTGERETVGLALVKRADSIMKQMKDMDLEVGSSSFREMEPPTDITGSGIIQPPPLDPLDGLEVIVGGSFTVGKLKMIPSRRYRRGKNMFEDVEIYDSQDEGAVMGFLQRREPAAVDDRPTSTDDELEDEDLDKAMEEAAKAQAEAEAAAAEAERKAEKMEILQRRAEEAMARRKAKKQQ